MFTKMSRKTACNRSADGVESEYVQVGKAMKGKNMQATYDFLKRAGTYFLATCDAAQPRVRPFGTVNLFNGRLYIQTGKAKAVSRQLHSNPKLELCATLDGRWIRVEATAVEDDSRAARVSMLEAYPALQSLYSPDDGNTEVWYLRKVTATIYSFTEPPETHRF